MKFSYRSLSVLLLFILSACGGDDEPTVNPLVGEWELTGINVSNPPSGYSLELLNTSPPTTIFGETSYTLTLSDDLSYERAISNATVFDTDGNAITANLLDDGEWSQNGQALTLVQASTNVTGLATQFDISGSSDQSLILSSEDLWFAWPPEITNDEQALDTIDTDEKFFALFQEYAAVVNMTVTLNFQKN